MKYYNDIEQYRLYLFQYGIITMILLIEHFEALEMYEECDKIIKAINYNEKLLRKKLHTKITKECIEDVKKEWLKCGIPKQGLISVYSFYRDVILDELIIV